MATNGNRKVVGNTVGTTMSPHNIHSRMSTLTDEEKATIIKILGVISADDAGNVVKSGLTTSVSQWTAKEKEAARVLLETIKKPANPSGNSVLSMQADGTVSTAKLDQESATPGSVPARDSNGCVHVGTPSANGHAASKSYVDGKIKCFGSLKDIGITSFPTTMAEVAEKMPANSMIVICTSKVKTGGAEEIEDWGSTTNGTAYINKGSTIARVTMMILYGSSDSNGCNLHIGNWSQNKLEKKVQWEKVATTSYVDSKPISGVAYDGFEYMFVDGTTTNTVQNGTSTYPFKTMDQFFDYCNRSGRLENRCMIQSEGTYKTSKTLFTGGAFHIRANANLSRDKVKLIFERENWEAGIVTFYGTHYNFRNLTLANYCSKNTTHPDGSPGFSFETCVVGLDGCRVIGENIKFTQCYLAFSAFNSQKTSLTDMTLSGCNGHINDLVILRDANVSADTTRAITVNAASHILFNNTITVPTAPSSGTSYFMVCTGSTVAFDCGNSKEDQITRFSGQYQYSQGIHAKCSTVFLPEVYANDLARISAKATHDGFSLPNLWVKTAQNF